MNDQALFRLRGVRKAYRREHEAVQIFDGLDMDIARGSFLAVMGPSGSGKTTLLNLLAGVDRPDSGELWFGDQRIDRCSEAQLSAWRARHVGFVFQHYNLLPMLSVARNVELPLLLTGLPAAERQRRVDLALQLVGIAHCQRRLPAQLSGGQQQRVGIARAIVADSELIVCDEPTGNLDRQTSVEVLDTLQLLNEEFGKTIVMVTHDPRAAERAGECRTLDKGRFVSAAEAAHA
ncbi:ABC transporter ATP-binding protein [Paucibacter sp. DJ1R-11]|uniref:ABC transporter ATP-binding protein n=1 Tax=Paucibacter sp. DJ1R-11 TaxID=2893556 RepID=UPI0021E50025|nr:ABC transporter ATP-binding protein [Paucibacter sp. DJ1R-11]MCV2365755.1 ABC transporter ATP-binding protein [Paucibacter sp. DJ1R-11]